MAVIETIVVVTPDAERLRIGGEEGVEVEKQAVACRMAENDEEGGTGDEEDPNANALCLCALSQVAASLVATSAASSTTFREGHVGGVCATKSMRHQHKHI